MEDHHQHYCDLCPFTAADSGALLFHTALGHKIRTRFECEDCGEAFEFRESAVMHVLEMHLNASLRVDVNGENTGEPKDDDDQEDVAVNGMLQPEVVLGNGEEDELDDGEELEEGDESLTEGEFDLTESCFTEPGGMLPLPGGMIPGKPGPGPAPKRFKQEPRLENAAIARYKGGNTTKRYSVDLSMEDQQRAQEQSDRLHAMSSSQLPPEMLRCDVSTCLKELSSKSSLQNHVDCVHLKLRPFKCPICGQGFSLKQHMQTHVREIHERTRVPCEICGKTYSSKVGLHYHRNTVHKGIIFGCDVCGRTFTQRNTLVTHMKGSHPDAPIPPKEETQRLLVDQSHYEPPPDMLKYEPEELMSPYV